jgi:Skp family chaperone for outer membrane proteins
MVNHAAPITTFCQISTNGKFDMMKNALLAVPLCLAALFAVACEQQPQTPPGTVALIEMDRIAKATGRDAVFNQQLQDRHSQLVGQLQTIAQQMETQLQAEQAKLTDASTDDDRARIGMLYQGSQQQLTRMQQQIPGEMENYRAELALQMRNEVRPAVRAVMEERGFSLVMEDNSAIIVAADGVDITDDVIKRLTTAATGSENLGAKLAPPGQLPPLNLPQTTNTPPQIQTPALPPAPATPSGTSAPASAPDAPATQEGE